MTKEQYYILLGSLIAIAVTWFLNQVAEWLKIRKDDKVKLKHVLFNLLELYYHLKKFDLIPVKDFFNKKMDELIPVGCTVEKKEVLIPIVGNIFEVMKLQLLPSADQLLEMQKSYKSSVNTLITIDPILAFNLSGKEEVIEKFSQIDKLMKDVTGAVDTEYTLPKDVLEDLMKPGILNFLLNDLEEYILRVAVKIDLFTWIGAKNKMRILKKSVSAKTEESINKMFEELKKSMPFYS